MQTYDTAQLRQFNRLLVQRESDLLAAIGDTGAGAAANEAGLRDVVDFKEIATEQLACDVDEAKAGRAWQELDELLSARRRLADHSYGMCVDCGDAIDPRRLALVPTAAYCTACQEFHEHERALAGRR